MTENMGTSPNGHDWRALMRVSETSLAQHSMPLDDASSASRIATTIRDVTSPVDRVYCARCQGDFTSANGQPCEGMIQLPQLNVVKLNDAGEVMETPFAALTREQRWDLLLPDELTPEQRAQFERHLASLPAGEPLPAKEAYLAAKWGVQHT